MIRRKQRHLACPLVSKLSPQFALAGNHRLQTAGLPQKFRHGIDVPPIALHQLSRSRCFQGELLTQFRTFALQKGRPRSA